VRHVNRQDDRVVGFRVQTEQAIHLDPKSQAAWVRHAFALARTDRVSAAIGAAERALSLNGHDAELAELLERLRNAETRVLPAA